jgi:hypothetical protein
LLGEDISKEKGKLDEYFKNLSKPNSHHPYDGANIIKKNDRDFETTCIIIEEHGNQDAAELSLFRFISRIKKIEKDIEDRRK